MGNVDRKMNTERRPGVVTVGSINIDLVVKTLRRPQAGETFPGDSFAIYVGGKGVNQAVQAALSGATSYFVARVGNDVFMPLVMVMLTQLAAAPVHFLSSLRAPSVPMLQDAEMRTIHRERSAGTITTQALRRCRFVRRFSARQKRPNPCRRRGG